METLKSTLKKSPQKTTHTNDNDPPANRLVGATPQQAKRDKIKRQKLYRCCASLAKSKNVLAKFDDAVHATGLAGEHRNARLIYLAVISRLFDRPVSIVVKGSSSGGKNTLVSAVLKFFPPNAFYEMTGMSEKVLAYFSEPLKNRVLVISEAAGLQGQDGSVLLRNLLSEGFLKYCVTVGKKAVTVELEGPTGAIITTTDLELYHDDETRLFSVDVVDTPAQSRKVLDLIGKQEETGVRANGRPGSEWHALMQWIEARPRLIINPYGTCISALVPENGPPRLNRDLKAAFALVRAHALLHQKTREKGPDGSIIATLEDYKAVRRLVNDIISEGIDAAVAPGVRRTVDAAAKLLRASAHVSGAQLGMALGVHKSNVSRNVTAAIKAGYLHNQQEGKGKTAQYVLGGPMPKDSDVLPSSKAVAKEYRRRTGKTAASPLMRPQHCCRARHSSANGRASGMKWQSSPAAFSIRARIFDRSLRSLTTSPAPNGTVQCSSA